MQFDHVGIPTTEKKPGESFVAATRVWITQAHQHPYRVEWLRFEDDSPVTGPLREEPHVGFRVENENQITELSKGMKVLLEPFDAGFAVAGFYQTEDGANIEFVWYGKNRAGEPDTRQVPARATSEVPASSILFDPHISRSLT